MKGATDLLFHGLHGVELALLFILPPQLQRMLLFKNAAIKIAALGLVNHLVLENASFYLVLFPTYTFPSDISELQGLHDVHDVPQQINTCPSMCPQSLVWVWYSISLGFV